MKITLNGEEQNIEKNTTISELLKKFDVDERKVAIERNLAIVPRSTYAETSVEEGDRLEIVHFIGGG